MRDLVPGTKHSSAFDRDERPILEDIENAVVVRKLKSGRMAWTGPTYQRRLRLRQTVIEGTTKRMYIGWLFIGSGKRHLKIYPYPTVTMEALVQELTGILAKYGVVVEDEQGTLDTQKEMQEEHHSEYEFSGDIKNYKEDEEMQGHSNSQSPLVTDDAWTYCELVYEAVKEVKALAEQEASLQTQLASIQKQVHEVKTHAVELLHHVLEPAADASRVL